MEVCWIWHRFFRFSMKQYQIHRKTSQNHRFLLNKNSFYRFWIIISSILSPLFLPILISHRLSSQKNHQNRFFIGFSSFLKLIECVQFLFVKPIVNYFGCMVWGVILLKDKFLSFLMKLVDWWQYIVSEDVKIFFGIELVSEYF